jgi:hypothetical protein
MTSKSINRSGLLLIISGILMAGAMLFHPDVSRPDAFQGRWGPVHFLIGISALLSIFGLAGLYSVMRTKITVFGLWAFSLAILGSIMISGMMFFFEATLVPLLASNPAAAPLLSDNNLLMSGSFRWMAVASLLIAALGWVFLAGHLMGTKTISTVNGLLLLVGAPLLLFSPPLPFAFGMIGGLLLGAGTAWLGISIRRGAAHEALKESLRLADECFIQAGGHA